MQIKIFRSLLAVIAVATPSIAATTLIIATVSNPDMERVQELSNVFTAANPDIKLEWIVLDENTLRQRVTTDIATGSGRFDIVTIGLYEAPIWAERGWLSALDTMPAAYDVYDLLPTIREGLSFDGKLYAAPFYGESSFTMYRTDLFEEAGLEMPDAPSWDFIRKAASAISQKRKDINGVCLRGKPGWGGERRLDYGDGERLWCTLASFSDFINLVGTTVFTGINAEGEPGIGLDALGIIYFVYLFLPTWVVSIVCYTLLAKAAGADQSYPEAEQREQAFDKRVEQYHAQLAAEETQTPVKDSTVLTKIIRAAWIIVGLVVPAVLACACCSTAPISTSIM